MKKFTFRVWQRRIVEDSDIFTIETDSKEKAEAIMAEMFTTARMIEDLRDRADAEGHDHEYDDTTHDQYLLPAHREGHDPNFGYEYGTEVK